MAKRSKNLSLDLEVIKRAELYSELHDTNVSQLVSNFLEKLPDAKLEADKLTPAVGRLLGIATSKGGAQEYHRHLARKYGR